MDITGDRILTFMLETETRIARVEGRLTALEARPLERPPRAACNHGILATIMSPATLKIGAAIVLLVAGFSLDQIAVFLSKLG